jgi:O-antigen ligase
MDGLIVIAAIVGAIWAAVLILRMPLLLGVLATVLVGACFGYNFFTFQIGGQHWTLDRVLLPVLIVAFIIQRQQGATDPKPWGVSEWLMAALIAWLGISLILHDYRAAFGATATPLWRFSTAYCIPVLLYAIARQSRIGERQINWMHTVLALFGIYLAIIGIFEIMRWWSLVYPKYIADPNVGLHFGRARGPMVTAVSFGLYLGTCFFCLWAIRDRLGRFRWLIIPPLALLELAALYFSYTRSCWVGTGLGLVLILALSLRGRLRFVAVAGLLLGAAILMFSKMDSLLAFKREQSAATVKESAESRLSFAYISWLMFKDSPVWGVGFGQFPTAKMPYLSERSELPLEPLRELVHHNTFLSLLTETGIVGLGLFLAVLFAWSRHAWLIYRDRAAPPWARQQAILFLSVMGLYVCQLMFHELSYSTIDNCLVFLLAGATTGIGRDWSKVTAGVVLPEPSPVREFRARQPSYRLVPR